MVLNGFDSVKAFSIGDYSRRRKLKWLFEFFVLLFLVLNQSSLFSLAGPIIRHFCRQLVVVFNSHIFVFFVFHAMLFVVYSLSHLTDNKSGSNRTAAAATGGELLDSLTVPRDNSVDEISVGEKITATSSVVPVVDPVEETISIVGEKIVEPPPKSLVAPVVNTVDEILTVSEKIPAISPVNGVSIDGIRIQPSSTVRHFNSKREQETRRYRRTESERFEENQARIKLRRSMTEIHREDGGEPARLLNPVDEMDIDDFNQIVESFIAEQKLHIGRRITGAERIPAN